MRRGSILGLPENFEYWIFKRGFYYEKFYTIFMFGRSGDLLHIRRDWRLASAVQVALRTNIDHPAQD